MKKINGTDKIWGDSVHIILPTQKVEEKGIVITKYISCEYGESMTYNDALQIAKENGFIEGTFLIMVESPLRGIIYQYANCYECAPFWSEYGTTQGYA